MGRIKTEKRKRRGTSVLKEIIGTDLLTWKEKLIQGTSSGLYSLANEQAYFKVPSDKQEMSIAEFDRKLKTEIDQNFTIVYNSAISSEEHIYQGHTVYFYVPAYDGYVQVINCGINGNKMLPAESVGRIVRYKGESYERTGQKDEEGLLYRGWVATFEACKNAYDNWEVDGISPAMCINPKEISEAMMKQLRNKVSI